MIDYLEACQRLADARGMSRREFLRSYSRQEILRMLSAELGVSLVLRQHVPQEILDAGQVVAERLGIPRKRVFREHMDAVKVEMGARPVSGEGA